MFQEAELARLQAQKELLVLQSRANRLLLAAEWQKLRSPERWQEDMGRWARQHPFVTATLATAAGVLAVKVMRKPAAIAGGLGRLGALTSLAFSVWKTLRREK